ncbi:MAG: ABC transporter substrate-binding protein, partial [Clostridiales bacterium]|nr:ABC transporter substrate-binding protein [Clostridiales bacterium]
MRKLLALVLASIMMLSVVSFASAENQLIYGSSTEISGDWAHGAIWTNNAVDNMIRGLINDYDTVVFDQGGALVQNMSTTESIESVVNEDGTKTFTVKVKEGLEFNDGSPMNAQHYLANLLLFSHPTLLELGSKSTGFLTYVGGEPYAKGVVAEGAAEGTAPEFTKEFSGARLLDDYTYSLTVVEDKIPYFYDLSYAALQPLSLDMWLGEAYSVADDGEGAYLVGDMSVETLKDKVEKARFQSEGRVTAGPYNLVSYDTASKQAVLEINPNYIGNFEGQKPSVQKIIVTKAEDETQFDALKTGEINILDQLTGGEDINKGLDMVAQGGFTAVEFQRNGYGKLMFQCDFGPTQFMAVRYAVAHLLDRQEFANTFTEGYGALVHGPYGLAMWMFQESEEELNEKLNTYAYSFDDATQLLEEDGWVLDAQGNAWTSGIRYKEVTAEEAGDYKHNITLADGRVLMGLIIEWSSSEGNPVSELLATMLAENPDVATVGMEIRQNIMTFAELLNWMYRDKTVGDQYGVPTYGMYNLASNFTPIYDQAYSWTLDPELVEQGYNSNFLFDKELDKLSMDMVYGVDASDIEGYRKLWVDFIVLWNELLPEVPLYSNIYYTVHIDT